MRRGWVVLVAVVVLAIAAGQAGAQSQREKSGIECDVYGCAVRDRLGGVGSVPMRTYRLVYGSAPICMDILRTLNETLRKPAGALARVTLPLTAQPGDVDALHEYVAQNPLYSAPMFLRWHYLGGYPFSAQMRPEKGEGEYNGTDAFLARWQIVRLLGVRRLVTATGSIRPVEQVPPIQVNVWDVPEEELDRHDWNVPASYRAFNFLLPEPNPVERLHRLHRPPSVNKKKICEKYGTPEWKDEANCHWDAGDVVNFAAVDGHVYTLIADPIIDIVTIFESEAEPLRNICNLESSLTKSLLKARLNPRSR